MKLTKMMYPQSGGRMTFKYPENRRLRINGNLNVTRELLANPDLYDSEGQPALSPSKTVALLASLLDFTWAWSHSFATKTASSPSNPQTEGRRVLSPGRLGLPYLRRPRSHGWPPPLWDVEKRLGQCPPHVCYPCLPVVAHGSHEGEVSTRQLQPHHLVKARLTPS